MGQSKTVYTAEEWRNRKTGRASKYKNKRVKTQSGWFDSKGELARWQVLLAAEKDGDITGLERQVEFPIIVKEKLIARYKADFVYYRKGERIVEDFKGVITKEFRLKQKLIEALYGFQIKITKKSGDTLD